MRLLKREKSGWLSSTCAFSLTKFGPAKFPRYAIFSHRWGPDEVTYQDIERDSASVQRKAGYRKLDFCAEQAACDGLVYFWIDTCCIDKTNSVEHSEAINSMFKWYQNASKCYVYLPDVSIHHPAGSVSATKNWELPFEKSEWFTRGWTLQELIAPTEVEFFSVEGTKLGDKKSLGQQICHITGIPDDVLQGRSLSTVDVQERLSWTAKRQTTVEEDAVYCLLGIFDIQMPLVYAEGQQKALARLQREIQRSFKPNSFVAIDAPWIVPFERNPHFTGRESQLAQLEGKRVGKDHTSRIAITGLGGVGKTQLVLELLYRTKEKHKDCSIIWIPAMTVESLQQGYIMVAQQLEIPGYEDENVDVKKLVQEYLSKEEAGPWLLVFDNADDITLWTSTPKEVKRDINGVSRETSNTHCWIDYLPRHKKGCIIFTTRDRKAAVSLAQQNVITVAEMGEEGATQLLKTTLANPDLVNDIQHVTALLAALTYLPLAITQATAYINANDITLADYVSLLGEREEDAVEILSEDFEDYGRYRETRNPVATTWLISFEQIRRCDALAADYLSFIACINPRDISESLLPPGASRKKELDAIGTLTAYSFISRRPLELSFDLHRLVYLATRNWLRQQGLLSKWTERAIIRVEEVFPTSDQENRTTWRKYLPHASQILASDLVSEGSEQRLELMCRFGECLSRDGRWDEAEAIFVEILAIKERMSSTESAFILAVMAGLGSTYSDQGRWEEAEQLQVQVMERSKTYLGPDREDTLRAMAALAVTYKEQGKWKEAEQLNLRVLEIRKGKPSHDHSDMIASTNDLALIYLNQGRLQEAEQLQLQVIEAYKIKFGVDHPHTLTSMHNLASIYIGQGRLQEAEQLSIQVIEMRKAKLGSDHPDTLTNMSNLASIYLKQGRLQEAEQLNIQVIEMRKAKLGSDHPSTLTSMHGLVRIYTSQARLQEAEQLSIQVTEMSKAKLGSDHPDTLASMHNLAWIWKDLARDAQAIELMRDCVQRSRGVLGTTHRYTLGSEKHLTEWEAEGLVVEDEVSVEEGVDEVSLDNRVDEGSGDEIYYDASAVSGESLEGTHELDRNSGEA